MPDPPMMGKPSGPMHGAVVATHPGLAVFRPASARPLHAPHRAGARAGSVEAEAPTTLNPATRPVLGQRA